MNNAQLCLALMRADTEDTVVELLQVSGYWDKPSAWRYLGDQENNYSSIGNQQSNAIPALIEKLVNGVDARLLNACLEQEIDPEGSSAPNSIREAVGRFFEDHGPTMPSDAGLISSWTNKKATREGQLLTLAATGYGPRAGSKLPSLTIADAGEGQTPDNFPYTFLSLHRSNKLRVPFVQGKFNMGATGALQFCSPNHRLQLIVSRRNPSLLSSPTPKDEEWGFTVVRRESPTGGRRNSVFTYLAPLEVKKGRDGRVLSFEADMWPIFPRVDSEGRDAYGREAEHGSLIKLYEYGLDGNRSNIVFTGGGLLQRVDFGMPQLALPIRLYECRGIYKGHSGSFATNVLGVGARLDRDRRNKLEDRFPIHEVLKLENRELRVRIYALKGSAKEYRSGRDAIVFTINGQAHATKPKDFFTRKAVGLSQLSDSLMVVVDCSNIEGQLREDLFMNSRDRLRDIPLSARLERALEKVLKSHPYLKELKNRRREEEIAEKLRDEKPLAEALEVLVQQTPNLSKLLTPGHKIPSPFPNRGSENGPKPDTFSGKRFPTFFRFRNKADGDILERKAHLESTSRIRFETDAQDDYFGRDRDRGSIDVEILRDSIEDWEPLADFHLNGPSAGIANLSFDLPQDTEVGQALILRVRVTDPSRVDAFELEAVLEIAKPAQPSSGTSGKDRKRNTGSGGGDDPGPVGLPNVRPVYKAEWDKHDFDELSALKVVGQGIDGKKEIYDFYVNCDNKYLLTAQKDPQRDPEMLRVQFLYSLVLYAMALLNRERSKAEPNADSLISEEQLESFIREVTRRLAPFVLPTLEAMGSLDGTS
ncbi:MAG: hypothetical protein KTV45_16175 [Acidimicrobiia bacterium]|nr:hypothetical protein [Acidimicrobiia bacterium]